VTWVTVAAAPVAHAERERRLRKERLSMYLLKKHLLPLYYWHALLKGRL
jgi:hypothetical protein